MASQVNKKRNICPPYFVLDKGIKLSTCTRVGPVNSRSAFGGTGQVESLVEVNTARHIIAHAPE
jgi:hypothetical protein